MVDFSSDPVLPRSTFPSARADSAFGTLSPASFLFRIKGFAGGSPPGPETPARSNPEVRTLPTGSYAISPVILSFCSCLLLNPTFADLLSGLPASILPPTVLMSEFGNGLVLLAPVCSDRDRACCNLLIRSLSQSFPFFSSPSLTVSAMLRVW